MQRRQFFSSCATVAAAAVSGTLVQSAVAATRLLPNKPIRLVVGFPAGGGTDVLARIVAAKLTALWSVSVVVENKAGAAGMIAAADVAKAVPDGTTLMMGHINALGIAPGLYNKLAFNPQKDFTAIALIGQTPQVLIANPEQVARTIPQVVALCKQKPGEVSFGSSGTGSAQHLALALFEQNTGVTALHVPYKGAAPVMTDLIGGQLQYAIEGMTTAAPFIKSGKLRAIAQTGSKRVKAFADVPTVAEAGYPNYQASIWFGLVGPGGMNTMQVHQMNADINKVLAMPDVVARLEEFGAEDGGGSAQRFEKFMQDEQAKWARVIKDRAITIDA